MEPLPPDEQDETIFKHSRVRNLEGIQYTKIEKIRARQVKPRIATQAFKSWNTMIELLNCGRCICVSKPLRLIAQWKHTLTHLPKDLRAGHCLLCNNARSSQHGEASIVQLLVLQLSEPLLILGLKI